MTIASSAGQCGQRIFNFYANAVRLPTAIGWASGNPRNLGVDGGAEGRLLFFANSQVNYR